MYDRWCGLQMHVEEMDEFAWPNAKVPVRYLRKLP